MNRVVAVVVISYMSIFEESNFISVPPPPPLSNLYHSFKNKCWQNNNSNETNTMLTNQVNMQTFSYRFFVTYKPRIGLTHYLKYQPRGKLSVLSSQNE